MKTTQMLWGVIAVLGFTLVACSDDLVDKSVVKDYAVDVYIQPDTIELSRNNENVGLYLTGKECWKGSKEHAAYAVRYGDRKEKRYAMNAGCGMVVGVEQMKVLQRLNNTGDTIDVSQYYDVVYRDNKAYVQGGGKYRLKNMPYSKEGRVPLSECTKEQCMWIFCYPVLECRDTVVTASSKGEHILVLTLEDGRKLTTTW